MYVQRAKYDGIEPLLRESLPLSLTLIHARLTEQQRRSREGKFPTISSRYNGHQMRGHNSEEIATQAEKGKSIHRNVLLDRGERGSKEKKEVKRVKVAKK